MYQIITDSCCDIPFQQLEEVGVAYIPMLIEMDGQEYVDDLGKTFDYEQFLEKIKANHQATTTQINVGRYVEFFRPYVEQQTPILYLAFSSGMSGSYNSALQAVALLKEDYPEVQITVVDTLAACAGEGLLVMEAQKRQAQGKTLEEVAQWVEKNKMNLQSWVTVDDLKHLERGGRISKTAAAVGGLLNVKPIIHVDATGHLKNVDKVRGRNKSLQKVADETINRIASKEDQIIYIAYSGDRPSAEKVADLLKQKITIKELKLLPMGPTIASHTGYGCIAVFSFGETRVD
ncbi:DegV family protein [Enterococcus massiliensis]|uniref:DegV family protein n=1 Tax=Enterococcus massiliensis TaxID=1640685 RepID=UPI00065E2539|nr:DegV family protein [Enterococcus massiliensis]